MSIALICAGAACALYGASIMRLHSGSSFYRVWYALAAVLLIAGGAGPIAQDGSHAESLMRAVQRIVAAALVLGVAAVGAVGWRIMTLAHREPPDDLAYLIVLGAQVRADGTPSGSLRRRLESALAYLRAHPRTRAIVSGGQGPNEPCSEAHAMRAWLLDRGIAADRVLAEAQSTTTAETLSRTGRLIDPARERVGIVTNDFHLYRALAIARHAGYAHAWGIPAPSRRWYLPNNVLREVAALVKNKLRGTM